MKKFYEPWIAMNKGPDTPYHICSDRAHGTIFASRICKAEADRIVSCVNACAGLNPEAVPELLKVCELHLRKDNGVFDSVTQSELTSLTRKAIEMAYNTEAPEPEANAARIVACVNACAGINPEAVPEMLAMLVEARKWIGSMGTIAVNADAKTSKEFGQLMGAYKTLPERLNAVIKKAGYVPPSMKALPVDPSHWRWEKDYGSSEPQELSANLAKLVTDPNELMKSLAESSKARVLAKVDARLAAEKETDDDK